MPDRPVERKLTAILAADVVGYSRLMGADEVGTLHRLTAYRAIVDGLIAAHRGRIFNTAGDSVVADFASAVDAVECALAVQKAVAGENAKQVPGQEMQFRIGIHVGDVIVQGDNLLGDGVNIAARLESLAEPGGICVSGTVHDQIGTKLPVSFAELAAPTMKNIAQPVRAYRIEHKYTMHETLSIVPPLTLPDRPSIAVLPFQNMSGDLDQEYFADGMVEDIITALSRIRWLFVIARNSSFIYKGQHVDIKQVGRDLGVRYVLEGSVRKGGNRVRVTAQLIDAVAGAHIWAERYDRDLSDVFAVQDEITASVAGLIEPALAEAEQHRVLRKPPDRLDAWEAYQRGLWHFYKYTREDNQIGLGFFRQAIAIDPKFAPGHYGYALALQWDIWHFSERPFAEVQQTPLEEARIAVSLDDKDAMAHAVLAHMLMWGSEWEAAIAEARTARALNPNNAFVVSMLGCVLGFGGYYDEALDQLKQAMRASPHDPLTWLWTMWVGAVQLSARKFAVALETYRQLVRLRPGYIQTQELIAVCLAHLGRLDEARDVFGRIPAQFSSQLRRFRQRPPWVRPEDYAIRQEGLRLAAGDGS